MPSEHGQEQLYISVYVLVDTASKRISFLSTLQLKVLNATPGKQMYSNETEKNVFKSRIRIFTYKK